MVSKMQNKTEVADCAKSPTRHHFWKIELPNGPVSNARCKYCGAEKSFYNSKPKDKDDSAIVVHPHKDWLYTIGHEKRTAR